MNRKSKALYTHLQLGRYMCGTLFVAVGAVMLALGTSAATNAATAAEEKKSHTKVSGTAVASAFYFIAAIFFVICGINCIRARVKKSGDI